MAAIGHSPNACNHLLSIVYTAILLILVDESALNNFILNATLDKLMQLEMSTFWHINQQY